MATQHLTQSPTARLALIKSIVGHSEGRDPAHVLHDIESALHGYSLEEIAAQRAVA